MERETGFEPATSTLARSHSTTELFPPGEPLNYHEATVRLKPDTTGRPYNRTLRRTSVASSGAVGLM
jgi:hypothetical protein